jgi:23S rRNA pseudouridine2605 synthase
MLVRLQKIIADAGITSRRKAETLILEGRVTVNGQVMTELGSKADPERDHVKVNGKLLHGVSQLHYLLLNKPIGYLSTVRDPQNRPTVMKLVKGIRERVYPVGRLDYNSSGIMILTNDGELANLLMSRAAKIPRTYHVKLEGSPRPEDLQKLKAGIILDGEKTAPAEVRLVVQRDKPWYEITLTEGRNHQVRRMFERIGQPVVKLKRVRIAFLTDEGIPLGTYRELTPLEVDRLKKWKRPANPSKGK